jgi:P pilus assembly chaperone PapD
MSFDSVPPTVDALLIEGTGAAPWYRSAVTLTASGTDASSGIDSENVIVDGAPHASPYTITTEGSYSAYGQVTDAAGNTAYTGTITINIDLTPPTSSLTSSGETIGDNGWLIAPLTLTASGSDGLSGVGSENVIVNGGAQGSTTTLDTEGSFTVYAQVMDTAGNTSDSVSATYNLDLNPPVVTINPVDGMSLLPMYGKRAMPSGGFLALSGHFTLSGMVSDTTSGINTAEYSVDGGSSWISLPVAVDGSYSVVVDTTRLPGGSTTFLVRAFDQAGLSGTDSISGVVANAGPKVTLTSTWFLSQSGSLSVKTGDTAISRVTISICDPSDPTICVTETYASNSIPSSVSWDGLFGSRAAAAGPYLVVVTARDTAGKSDSATGTIVIPVTPTPTAIPTRLRQVVEVINTPIPTPVPTTVVVAVEPPDETPKVKHTERFKTAPHIILLLFVGLFAFMSMADPRPRQWQRVARAIQKMNEINRK